MIGTVAAVVVALAFLPAAAGADEGRVHRIRLEVKALEPLSGAFYELWVVTGDQKLSAGAFNVAADGSLVNLSGSRARFASPVNPASADAIVVTIEPLPDPDPGPSGIAVLAGPPIRGHAKLAFPVSFAGAAGSFILATPTTSATNDETSGVWFLDPAAGPGPSLDIPTLPGGWVFEGWGVTQGVPMSTGRFSSPSGADGSAMFSGPLPGPPFPGEDFVANLPAGVTPPVDLADGSSAIVLTVEPDLGGTDPTGPGPFSIKPLLVGVPSGAAPLTSIELDLDLSTVPTGRAGF